MRANVPAAEVISRIFWMGDTSAPLDPHKRRIAECVAAIRPQVEAASREHGDRHAMWGLLAILVHMACERGDGPAVAAMMRTNARVIELEAGASMIWPD